MRNISMDLDGTLTHEDLGSLHNQIILDEARIDKILARFHPKPGIEVLEEYHIVPTIRTGRSECRRQVTEWWLQQNDIKYKELIMCPNNYYDVTGFNWERYHQLKLKQHLGMNIDIAFDDRLGVVEILNSVGILTYLVGDNLRNAVELAFRSR